MSPRSGLLMAAFGIRVTMVAGSRVAASWYLKADKRMKAMKLIIELGGFSKTRIEFSRNWFTGRVNLDVGGATMSPVSPWNFSTHFTLRLTTEYQITLGRGRATSRCNRAAAASAICRSSPPFLPRLCR